MASRPRRTRRTPLERSRRRFARRQWARRWLTWRYLLAAVLVLALLGGSIYGVFFSRTLQVHSASVEGLDRLRPARVLEIAAVPTGRPLATVDLGAIERRVAALAEVREVEVRRDWPDAVAIEITERQPVAVVQRGPSLQGMDAEGVLFTTYRDAPSGLPRVETGGDVGQEALREAATVVGALDEALRARVDHVSVRGVDEIDLALRDERTVRWGSADQSELKADVLAALLAQPGRVVDVRVPAQPTTSG